MLLQKIKPSFKKNSSSYMIIDKKMKNLLIIFFFEGTLGRYDLTFGSIIEYHITQLLINICNIYKILLYG